MTSWRIVLWALCWLGFTACATAERGQGPATNTVDTTGAYPVFHARTPAVQWRTELEVEIGASDDGGSEFGGVRSVALGPNGVVAVLDHRTPQIVSFSKDGARLASWGRVGAGPGEYRWPYSIAYLGDSLLLFDPGLSRVTLYDHERRWLREWPTPRNTGGAPVRLYQNPPSSAWVFSTRAVSTGLERVFVRYPSTGNADTLPIPSHTFPPSESANCNSPDGSISFYSAPFAPSLLSTPLENAERVAVITTSYRLAFLSRAGDTTRVIERALAPAAVTDSLWAAATSDWTEFRRKIPSAHCSRESFTRPASTPLVYALFSDERGRLWVEAHGSNGVIYDVFAPDGTFMTSVSGLPASGDVVPSVLDGRIAIVVSDALGEQRVRVYRVAQR